MYFFYLLSLFLFLSFISSHITFIDISNSTRFDPETETLNRTLSLEPIGKQIPQRLDSNVIVGDQNIPQLITKNTRNGEIAAGFSNLIGATHNGKTINTQHYKLLYSLFNNTYSNYTLENFSNIPQFENANEFERPTFECEYTVNPLYLDKFEIILTNEYPYKDMIIYNNTIFGLNTQGEVYLIKNYTLKEEQYNLKEVLSDQGSVINTTITEMKIVKDKDLEYLILYTSDNNCLIFSLVYYSDNFLDLSYIYSINVPNILLIGDIKLNGTDNTIILYDNSIQCFQIYDLSLQQFSFELSTNESNTLLSFDIIDNYIYALFENIGIYIYEINNNSLKKINSILHSFIIQFDIFLNPFTGNLFIGCLLSQEPSSQYSIPFFIEFYIKNKNHSSITINKLFFIKSTSLISSFLTIDYFYSYFPDKLNNNIILIRRGMLNSIPSITYKFQFNSTLTQGKLVPSKHPFKENSKQLRVSLLTPNKLYYADILTFSNYYLNCTFYEDGDYVLIFGQNVDACESSINTNESVCYKINSFNIKIKGDTQQKNVAIALGVCFGIILIVIVSLVTWGCMKDDDGNDKLKLVKIDKNDKRKLYQVDEDDGDKEYLMKRKERKPIIEKESDKWSLNEKVFVIKKREGSSEILNNNNIRNDIIDNNSDNKDYEILAMNRKTTRDQKEVSSRDMIQNTD